MHTWQSCGLYFSSVCAFWHVYVSWFGHENGETGYYSYQDKKMVISNTKQTIKLHTVADYNCHMGYVDKGDRMANSCSIRHQYGSRPNSCSSIC